ncbi:DNA-binding transcriptional LysR family regulator [Rhodobium orientis]|uniref:HTH lysR-type domain-containing protein n=1 Tax=Rhodobium orientis TaxID=34017 RepID=A0A327JSM1_9HYPH|nr:LysR family transcriptional regulator [Rhodobium orientis]MBB4303939.1 DNA-binding transcriptional LysR family regulator [Rhodobium orientis]MBK5950848.1 hypothetical protein [Rhodobium orientis]RAI29489.1 hypothetical protein CH339_02225 [Rhodobium orientis]
MNLRHLRAVIHTARLGSISKAAEAVHATQPAVSQAIAGLERSFDATLFERRASGAFPTSEGRLVADRGERLFTHLAEAERRILAALPQDTRRPTVQLGRAVSYSQLLAFATFARAGSFVAAASRLGLSVPTVHRSARAFERLAGIPLFEQGSHGIALNRLGADVAMRASLALREIQLIRQDLDESRGLIQGMLTIASLPLMRSYVLPLVLTRLSERHPAAEFSVVEGSYESLLHALRMGEVDVLLGALWNPAPAGDVREETLFDDTLSIVARAGHPLVERPSLSLADLDGSSWIVPKLGTPTRDIFEVMRTEGMTLGAPLIETSCFAALRGLLLESNRLAIISRRQIVYEERAGLLSALPVPIVGASRPVGLTVRVDWMPTQLARDFVDTMHASTSFDA